MQQQIQSKEFSETNNMIKKLEEKLKDCIKTQQKINNSSSLHEVDDVNLNRTPSRFNRPISPINKNLITSKDNIKVQHYLTTHNDYSQHSILNNKYAHSQTNNISLTNHQVQPQQFQIPQTQTQLQQQPQKQQQNLDNIVPKKDSLIYTRKSEQFPLNIPIPNHNNNPLMNVQVKQINSTNNIESLKEEQSVQELQLIIKQLEQKIITQSRQLNQKDLENQKLQRQNMDYKQQLQQQGEKIKQKFKNMYNAKKLEYKNRYSNLIKKKNEEIKQLTLGFPLQSLSRKKSNQSLSIKRQNSKSAHKLINNSYYQQELLEIKKENQNQYNKFKKDLEKIKTQLCIHRD